MKISENLQNLRKQQQLSQEQLANLLGISRQSVSKWESGDSCPETDKLIALCELFHCSLDELVMGQIVTKAESSSPESSSQEQKNILHQYDLLMNKFGIAIAAGVGIILLGITILLGILSLSEYYPGQVGYYETAGLVTLLLSTVLAMPFFIIYGMKLANFKAKYPQIKARYPESEVERQNGKFIINITISVILLVLGVTIMVLASGMHIFNNDSPLPATLLMVFVTASLPLSVFANIQHHKYNINKYNHTKTSSY